MEREREIKNHFAYEHTLVFKEPEEIVPFCCNACGLRVLSSPCYICTMQRCRFSHHEPCTQLPDQLDLPGPIRHTHDLRLLAKPYHEDCRYSKCGSSCDNIFTYNCVDCDEFDVDPLCGYPLDIRIKHVSHKEHPKVAIYKEALLQCDVCGREHRQHPLIFGGEQWLEDIISCCDQGNPFCYDLYSCTQCRFTIHGRCPLLPKTVTHKFDKHPLTLTTDSRDDVDDNFCEFCEEDMNPSYWFDRCVECHHSFHVDCISSTGEYSRIKFGGTVVLPACHGGHPLSLVRMLDVGSQTCGCCYKAIEGYKDGISLHCTQCDFWVHFGYGWESSAASTSKT